MLSTILIVLLVLLVLDLLVFKSPVTAGANPNIWYILVVVLLVLIVVTFVL